MAEEAGKQAAKAVAAALEATGKAAKELAKSVEGALEQQKVRERGQPGDSLSRLGIVCWTIDWWSRLNGWLAVICRVPPPPTRRTTLQSIPFLQVADEVGQALDATKKAGEDLAGAVESALGGKK